MLSPAFRISCNLATGTLFQRERARSSLIDHPVLSSFERGHTKKNFPKIPIFRVGAARRRRESFQPLVIYLAQTWSVSL